LAVLGQPERHFAALHVGGTNGKGSVAVLAAEALRAAGLRVGLYTSPHLVDIRERMLVDGRPIPADAFAQWTARLEPHLDRVGASFFEATTAMAFADFAARGADLAVVEVGLGGRLDATNVLTPVAAAVTRIFLDRCLGTDLMGIARSQASPNQAYRSWWEQTRPGGLSRAAEAAGAPVTGSLRRRRMTVPWRWRGRTSAGTRPSHGRCSRRSRPAGARRNRPSDGASPGPGSRAASTGVAPGCSTWRTIPTRSRSS
jgi:hypothetical protein